MQNIHYQLLIEKNNQKGVLHAKKNINLMKNMKEEQMFKTMFLVKITILSGQNL